MLQLFFATLNLKYAFSWATVVSQPGVEIASGTMKRDRIHHSAHFKIKQLCRTFLDAVNLMSYFVFQHQCGESKPKATIVDLCLYFIIS